MTSRVDSPGEEGVEFLNVDAEVYGAVDRAALVRGFGEAVVVLCEGRGEEGGPELAFELDGAGARTLEGTIAELIALVRDLPEDARAAWDAAARRVFDVGVQSGGAPSSSRWCLDAELVKALGEIGVELALTVYGAAPGTTE